METENLNSDTGTNNKIESSVKGNIKTEQKNNDQSKKSEAKAIKKIPAKNNNSK